MDEAWIHSHSSKKLRLDLVIRLIHRSLAVRDTHGEKESARVVIAKKVKRVDYDGPEVKMVQRVKR